MTDEAKRMALLNAIANATHNMGERTFVTHADAQHQYSLTPLGWAAAAIDTLQQRQEAKQREAARRAEEERRLAEEDARDKALAEEKVRREREAEEKRKAREKREKNAHHRAKIKREIRSSIEGMDLDEVTDALMSGVVAHCIVEI